MYIVVCDCWRHVWNCDFDQSTSYHSKAATISICWEAEDDNHNIPEEGWCPQNRASQWDCPGHRSKMTYTKMPLLFKKKRQKTYMHLLSWTSLFDLLVGCPWCSGWYIEGFVICTNKMYTRGGTTQSRFTCINWGTCEGGKLYFIPYYLIHLSLYEYE